jgi:hypothetical protein
MRCSAHSKRSGEACHAWAVRGRTTCRMHGGTSRTGMAVNTFKHGRYSRYVPPRLENRYESARHDPTLLEPVVSCGRVGGLVVW